MNNRPAIPSAVGFVRETPVTQQSAMNADVTLREGDWVILTGSQTFRDSQTGAGLPASNS
jgi:hypothetical protein